MDCLRFKPFDVYIILIAFLALVIASRRLLGISFFSACLSFTGTSGKKTLQVCFNKIDYPSRLVNMKLQHTAVSSPKVRIHKGDAGSFISLIYFSCSIF